MGQVSKSALGDGEENIVDDEDLSDLRSELPLPEGCLKVNLGIPIIVVVNKVDLVEHGDQHS